MGAPDIADTTDDPTPRISAAVRTARRACEPRPEGSVPHFEPPAEFDDYVTIRRLGGGAMGDVYLAEDSVLARRVAIKFISSIEPDAEARQRFLIEARAAARVQHPNVVTIYRVGELGERPYIVTEFARGQTLDAIEGPVPWRRALDIGVDLARGLASAHRRGVLHCDIKPANAILTEDGTAKLLDFGLATLLHQREEPQGATGSADADFSGIDSDERVASSSAVGTPDYMAPELWRDEQPTRRSDVYSLGALLYALCSERAPFEDVDVTELARAVQTSEAPPLVSRAVGVDPRFGAIVDRCIRCDPNARFASGDEVREALEQLLRVADGGAVPEGNPYRGLRPFDADHRALFFGRNAEIGIILERLRAETFVLVTGDSGVGKSSVCRAGVLPAVREGALAGGRTWSVSTFVPGKLPLTALTNALSPVLGVDAAVLRESAAETPGALAQELARHLGACQGVVLFIDQAEELLTVSEPGELEIFESAVAAILAGTPGVRLLSALRADFLTRFATLPALGEELSRILYFLRPLSVERTRDVIVGPAEVTGVRFESDALVDQLVKATARTPGGLPLLQFALAELWESRSTEGVITEGALASMGGVGGALARHADSVLGGLSPAQRVEARRMLMRLVTLENTRVRRSAVTLRAHEPMARSALDALVRGRLLVAQDSEEGSAFEVAHEVLIQRWDTLRGWLAEDTERRAVRERLAGAATEWHRLGRRREALWRGAQLAESARLEAGELTNDENDFIAASRSTAARTRAVRRAMMVIAPIAIAGVFGAAELKSRRAVARQVNDALARAQVALSEARGASAAADAVRQSAFNQFEARDLEGGERLWTQALAQTSAVGQAYGRASRILESALALDASRRDTRALLADTLYEQALVAERARKPERRDEYAERFTMYDASSALAAKWNAPAKLRVDSSPADARVTCGSFTGPTPSTLDLARGFQLLVLSAPGRAEVRYPLVLDRGEARTIQVELPPAAAVPAGFAYIPPGQFVFGSTADEQSRRGFFETVPAHTASTRAYLIAKSEVTMAEWIAFLEASSPAEREARRPRSAAKVGASGAMSLDPVDGGKWRFTMQPSGRAYTALSGEMIHYEGRASRADQDWRLFPVTGVSADDASAYLAWLRSSGRIPGARFCTEYEWERAARGADDREFPHGATLGVDDANFDATYGRDSMGLDAVGSHPASRSPFGVDDMVGNAFEWTTSSLASSQYVLRGGSYFHSAKTCQSPNRNVSTGSLRDATVGVRVCADP